MGCGLVDRESMLAAKERPSERAALRCEYRAQMIERIVGWPALAESWRRDADEIRRAAKNKAPAGCRPTGARSTDRAPRSPLSAPPLTQGHEALSADATRASPPDGFRSMPRSV